MENPFLPRNASDKEDERRVGIDPEAPQHLRRVIRADLVGVDPIVNHADLLGRYAVQRLDIVLHGLGDGDDAIRVLIGRTLDPGRGVVRGAKLLDFPWAVGFQRMRGEHQSGAGQRARETAGEMRIPGVAVDDVGRVGGAHHGEVAREGIEQPGVARIAGGERCRSGNAAHAQIPFVLMLLTKTKHVPLMGSPVRARELACEILDVDTRSAVDVRRVFVGEQRDAQGPKGGSR